MEGGGESTASSLLERSLNRDPAAWERLVKLYGPLVYGWCRNWGLQPTDADNVGQETFLKVSQRIHTFDRTRQGSTFRGWVFRISRNCAIDYLRKLRPGAVGQGGDAGLRILDEVTPDGVDEDVTTAEEKQFLFEQAVKLIHGEFSERDGRAFLLTVVEGRDPADVAVELQTSTNVVYLARSRILQRLKSEFDGILSE